MDAETRYEAAMRDIRRGLVFHQGAPAAEAEAAGAYAEMVRQGLATPVRRKYRVGRTLKKVR